MISAKKIAIIKTGDTLAHLIPEYGDFEDWIAAGLQVSFQDIRVVNVEQHQPLPEISDLKGVVISGSHAMVTQNLDWSLGLEAWIPRLIQERVPLLGICYGHQLIARAMGGVVDYHPQGLEIGTTDIELAGPGLENDPLFGKFPSKFKAHVVHSQTVLRLPESAVSLAKNGFEPHHGFRIGPSAWGIQFHPEFNAAVEKAYIAHLSETIVQWGKNPVQVQERVEETPIAAMVLQRFANLCSGPV